MGQTPLESGGRSFRLQKERFLYGRAPACVFPCRFALQTADGVRLPSLENAGGGMRRNGPGEFLRFWLLAPVAGGGKGQRPTEDT